MKKAVEAVVGLKTAGFCAREIFLEFTGIDVVEIAGRKPIIEDDLGIAQWKRAEPKIDQRELLVDILEIVDPWLEIHAGTVVVLVV